MDSNISIHCIIILTDCVIQHLYWENWSWNGERRDSVLSTSFYL